MEITISIDFTYEIGDENPITGEIIKTVGDAKQAVRDELNSGQITGDNVELTNK